ncbi:hypothetical protein DPMN_124071 [Dreissena polymorpha]|uniref:Uncharacterized protein n=1 Tax=Dreissena polymorpha TaxID=45954 RepID=A0A9D4GSU4_DREPO|nr:hypothetical protein DPMN_124071 [Dreissena polymorpha]
MKKKRIQKPNLNVRNCLNSKKGKVQRIKLKDNPRENQYLRKLQIHQKLFRRGCIFTEDAKGFG